MNIVHDSKPIAIPTWNFTVSEFIYDHDAPVPLEVLDAIHAHHMVPLNALRQEEGFPIIVSQRSCYRTVDHEKSKGRLGTSFHCFGTHIANYKDRPEHYRKGAADVTAAKKNMFKLFSGLVELSYRRVIYYPEKHFFHCDYNADSKLFYESIDNRLHHLRPGAIASNILKNYPDGV